MSTYNLIGVILLYYIILVLAAKLTIIILRRCREVSLLDNAQEAKDFLRLLEEHFQALYDLLLSIPRKLIQKVKEVLCLK